MAEPGTRRAAADRPATTLGGTAALLFVCDPVVETFLPAPELPQVLPGGRAWQTFLRACVTHGVHRGTAPAISGVGERPACALASDANVVLVVLGVDSPPGELEPCRPFLPLLAAAVRREWEVQTADAQRNLAQRTADHAEALAATLQAGARATLQAHVSEICIHDPNPFSQLDDATATGEEQDARFHMANMFLGVLEEAHMQYRLEKSMSAEDWGAWQATADNFLPKHYVARYWQRIASTFEPGFQRFVEERIRAAVVKRTSL